MKLDVGCGSRKQEGYLGVDIEPSPQVSFVMSATDLRFSDNTVDEIFCKRCLQTIPDDAKALKEFYRVMKPGGKVTVIVSGWLAAIWCRTVFEWQYKWRMKNLFYKRYKVCHFYLGKKLLRMLKDAGFSDLKSTKVKGRYPFVYDVKVDGYKWKA